ncbi:MAG: hypothetical protein LC131_03210 [Anaerolineae bacterium]|nr:hypothetical protein [Anaerolineae bacterium]GIK44736.1 MAG: hypothetical protein BroJett012_06390 [Betaproteobacteria bacterium]
MSNLSLPHAKRLEVAGYHELNSDRVMAELFLDAWPMIKAALMDPGQIIPRIIEEVSNKSERFKWLAWESTQVRAGYNFGTLDNLFLGVRCRLLPPRVFQVTDALNERLEQTDIGADMPCSFFRLPFPFIYIEFGQKRQSLCRVHNPVSGEHVAEGCFVQEVASDGGGREVHLTAIGSPVGKTGLLDDATISFRFAIDDENDDLGEALTKAFEHHERNARAHGLVVQTENDKNSLRDVVAHAAKVLLYLNSVDARTERVAEWSELAAARDRAGPAKKAKFERKLCRVYDRIVVGPQSFQEAPAGAGDGRHVQPHWRRGHLRRQRCGPGLVDLRIIWIRPVLIGGAAGLGKVYAVA